MTIDSQGKVEFCAECSHDSIAREAKVFFEESRDVFSVSDLETRAVLFVNPSHDRVLGAEARKSPNFIETVHPEDRELVLRSLAGPTEDGTITADCRCLNADGEYIWMQWRGFALPQEGKLYSIGKDISVQKEAQLRCEQLASIVEFSRDAIIGVDPQDVITSWNRGACQIFGYGRLEAEGMSVLELFDRDSLSDWKTKFGPGDSEILCLKRDGRVFHASVLVSEVIDHDHRRVGYSLNIRDISERKEMETRVKEFYSTVSHELRTPLTSIRGALAMISAGIVPLDSDEAMSLVNVAKDSSLRLIRLINDILDIQKIESGKMTLTKARSAPEQLIQTSVNGTTGMAESLQIEVATEVGNDLPEIEVDIDKLVQVLTNLISNALKFSPTGGTVCVCATTCDGMVRFSVRDQGRGIPENQSHKLFGKFQQLDSSDTREQGGTGLGLAISKALVEQHSGRIGYVNEDVGCTFWFEIPVASN